MFDPLRGDDNRFRHAILSPVLIRSSPAELPGALSRLPGYAPGGG